MLGVRVLDRGVDEHLDLVEPVHAEDAAGVLAVRAGLLAEARRERGVPQRECGTVEDLVGVVRRQRHLGGAHEVEVLALDPVDVVGGLAEEAGALHRARLDQGRRDHLREAGVAGLVHRHHDQRELELRADAGQEVEAAARHLRAALEVDGAEHLAELDVVARLEVELRLGADGLDHPVVLLAAGGRLVGGDVRDLHQRRAPELLGLGLGGLGGLDPARPAPWSARAARPSRRPAPAGSACPGSSAPPRSRSNSAIAERLASSAEIARSTTSSDRPRLAWAARTRSGSSRRRRGSIMGMRLSARRTTRHSRSAP